MEKRRTGLKIAALRVTGLVGPKGSKVCLLDQLVSSLMTEVTLAKALMVEHSEATSLQSQVQSLADRHQEGQPL